MSFFNRCLNLLNQTTSFARDSVKNNATEIQEVTVDFLKQDSDVLKIAAGFHLIILGSYTLISSKVPSLIKHSIKKCIIQKFTSSAEIKHKEESCSQPLPHENCKWALASISLISLATGTTLIANGAFNIYQKIFSNSLIIHQQARPILETRTGQMMQGGANCYPINLDSEYDYCLTYNEAAIVHNFGIKALTLTDSSSQDIALFFTLEDPQNPISFVGDDIANLLPFQNQYNTYFSSVRTFNEVCKHIKLANSYGNIKLLWLDTHGSESELKFFPGNKNILNDNSLLKKCLQPIDPNGSIVLHSCLTGKIPFGIAHKLSKAANLPVFAPKEIIYPSETKIISANPIHIQFHSANTHQDITRTFLPDGTYIEGGDYLINKEKKPN